MSQLEFQVSGLLCQTVWGTMLFPLVILTSYVKLQPLADGGDQDRVAVEGASLTMLGDAGAPGRAVQHNKMRKYIATIHNTIKRMVVNLNVH